MQSRHVQPGDLDQLVDIHAETVTADDFGGRAKTWGIVKSHWAQVTPLIGGEGDAHGTLRGALKYRFTIYADADVTARHRVVWNGMTFNITEARVQATHHRFMDLIAETGHVV